MSFLRVVCSSIGTTVWDTRNCSHQHLPDSNPRHILKTNMSHSKHSFSSMKTKPCSLAPCLSMYHHLQELNLMSSWLSSRAFQQTCCNVWRSIPADRLQTSCGSIFAMAALPVPPSDRCSTAVTQHHPNDWLPRSWATHNPYHQHLPFNGATTMRIMLGKPISITC